MNSKEPAFEIRSVRKGDIARLADLCTQLGYPTTPQALAPRLETILSLPDQLILVAVGPAGVVVGWIHAFIYRVLESEPMVEIGGLVVDQVARGQGCGRSLLYAVENWAVSRGVPVVSLRSNIIRVEAHEFYRHLGYAVPKTSARLPKEPVASCRGKFSLVKPSIRYFS